MFDWFKRGWRKPSNLANWQLGDLSAFEKIINHESTQYVHEASGRHIYCSILSVPGNGKLADEISLTFLEEPRLERAGDVWHLKGGKCFEREVLICVISFTRSEDEAWARVFLEGIGHRAVH